MTQDEIQTLRKGDVVKWTDTHIVTGVIRGVSGWEICVQGDAHVGRSYNGDNARLMARAIPEPEPVKIPKREGKWL